jgi:hypothetical protein
MKWIICLLLLWPAPAAAFEHNGDVMYFTPPIHFVFAMAGQYTLSTLCERTLERRSAFRLPTLRARYGCRMAAAAIIMAMAGWEWNHLEGFGRNDFAADLAGTAAGFVLMEW